MSDQTAYITEHNPCQKIGVKQRITLDMSIKEYYIMNTIKEIVKERSSHAFFIQDRRDTALVHLEIEG